MSESLPFKLSVESRCGRDCGCLIHIAPDLGGTLVFSLGFGVIVEEVDGALLLARLDNPTTLWVGPNATISLVEHETRQRYLMDNEQDVIRWLASKRPSLEEIL